MTKTLDRLGRGPVVFALLGLFLARLLAWRALEDVPHVMDEIAYTLQARTFASGHLVAPLHLPRGAFAMWFVEDRSAFYSIFPPGWPAVLSLGYLVGLARWVNPLLHGLTVLVVARSARRLSGSRAATLAAAFYALSPQALILAASLMSHALVALAAACVVDVALRASGLVPGEGREERVTAGPLAIAAAACGLSAMTRPLCGVILGVVLALGLGLGLRRRAVAPKHLAVVAAPLLASVAVVLAYNARLTGSPLLFPQTVFFDSHLPPWDIPLFHYRPGCNALGFGPSHGCEAIPPDDLHSPAHALSNFGDNMNAWLFLAGGGPLAFGLAAFALVRADRRRAGLLVLLPLPLAAVLYGLYWYAGTCYGARFYHAALPSLLLLAALGLEDLLARSRNVAIALGVVFLGWNAVYGARVSAELAQGYWGTDARFAKLAARFSGPKTLVLVAFADEDFHGHHDLTTFMRDVPWANNIRALGALAVNDPALRAPLLFARYHPGLMRELREAFPDRALSLYVVRTHGPDALVRYEDTALPALEATTPRPPDNFDGYLVPPEVDAAATTPP